MNQEPTSEGCENDCDLARYGTHQDDCPHEPHDPKPIDAKTRLKESRAVTYDASATPRAPKQIGEAVLWLDHYDKGHDVGTRHEDGRLYSATCHDCNVIYYSPEKRNHDA